MPGRVPDAGFIAIPISIKLRAGKDQSPPAQKSTGHDFHESAILGSTTNGTSGIIRFNASSIDSFIIAGS